MNHLSSFPHRLPGIARGWRWAGTLALGGFFTALATAADLGLFTEHTDIGENSKPGLVAYEPASDAYVVSSNGGNRHLSHDALPYAWKKISGDVAFTTDIDFPDTSAQSHPQAYLLFRASLAADSVYAGVVLPANGPAALLFRNENGGRTHALHAALKNPRRLRLEKIGDTVYLSLAESNGLIAPSGCSVRLTLPDEFYVGLGVSASETTALATARFTHVTLTPPIGEAVTVRSSLEIFDLTTQNRRSLYHAGDRLEAPNWSRDGTALIFNRSGRLYRLALASSSSPELIDTGFADRCNNDHGLSPDGSLLAISDSSRCGTSQIYVVPATGGLPREITPLGPSYWHGWSPDGRTLAFTAQRDGRFGIFIAPAAGGPEQRLTTTTGLDDGPDYSPDGQWIYFNSDRSGLMQIWRIHPTGTALEQITRDDRNNWFPHPSPDGKWMVYLSYDATVKGHPRDREVRLCLWSLADGTMTELAKFFGGQGTINVPSWSPDSTQFAYVRYQPAP